MRVAVLFIVVVVYSALCAGEQFSGRVVRIDEGDTIAVVTEGHIFRVKLFGVDCPEKKQPGASHAAWLTKELVLNRLVAVTKHNMDRYGRMIAEIELPDGRDLGQELIKTGNAWWSSKYAPDDSVLEDLEADARERRIGIWEGSNPLASMGMAPGEKALMERRSVADLINESCENNRAAADAGVRAYL